MILKPSLKPQTVLLRSEDQTLYVVFAKMSLLSTYVRENTHSPAFSGKVAAMPYETVAVCVFFPHLHLHCTSLHLLIQRWVCYKYSTIVFSFNYWSKTSDKQLEDRFVPLTLDIQTVYKIMLILYNKDVKLIYVAM